MAIRGGRPVTFRWRTLSDAIDSTNGPQGAALALANLVPAPFNKMVFVPRPAAVRQTTFAPFTGPIAVELEYVVGNRCYGFVQSTRFAGKSEPFVWDYIAQAFIPITGVTNANCPTSTSNTGDWTPPSAAAVGGDIVFTHPGFPGGATVIGWLDETGLTVNTITGSTHGTTLIDTLSANPIAAGVTAGMTISDSAGDIPANTTIVSLTTTTITISNAATGSNVGTTLTIAGGSFGAPHWAAGNINQNPLPSVPRWVANYAGSAWYAVGTAVQFSDPGAPLQQSNNPVPQVLNFQNGLTVTALSASPYQNALGSISSSLLIFQGLGGIFQVTGSAFTNNLSSQLLAAGIGTLAPNSVTFIPNIGTAFVAADGLRFVALGGQISPAVGTQGDGICEAFINVVNPSRMCAAWNSDTLRIALQNNTPPSGFTVTQEFWFHTKLNIWTGPHSFQTSLVTATQAAGGFIISSVALGASLWLSHAVPTAADGYVENGAVLTCGAMTSLLPDNEMMGMNALSEMTAAFASINGFTANIIVYREDGNALDAINIPVTGGGSTTWGSFTWGQARWGQNNAFFTQYQVPWSQPLLFKQCFINITFQAGPGNALGNLYMRIKPLGYLLLGENDAA